MKKYMFLVSVFCILLFSFLIPSENSSSVQASTAKEGIVNITSGTLNVRSNPSTKARIIGSLKKNQKVSVLSQNNGWVQIQFGKKKGYVASKYILIRLSISANNVKTITDKVIATQRSTWDRSLTKQQIYQILNPSFTKPYIDGYFKEEMRKDGIKNGVQMYHIIETEINGYGIHAFDWTQKIDPKPTYSYYSQNNVEYLHVSQFHNNEMQGNNTLTLSLVKEPRSTWKVYKINRVMQK